MQVPCQDCPLRPLALFTPNPPDEVALIQALRQGQTTMRPRDAIIAEGQGSAPLYTLFAGWAFRYKTLSDGRRQILNFLLPGDFIGVQQKMGDAMAHGVEALSEVVLCNFHRNTLWELHRRAPTLGFDVTWLTAHEESIIDEHMLSVGRRSAEDCIAALLIMLFRRAAAMQPDRGATGVHFPLTQQHIADAMGLSLVHTHRSLRKLERRGLHRLENERLHLLNPAALARLADVYGDGVPSRRPLI